ncbi:uncharacterized protein DNG_04367 [Cephalotrichum gorgonifer]|uniref:Uncharacterized protein n=1 Tax=Cephalotrichum gorgonifer TaxID=2041049 RepID=A0AAE8SUV5_9PEZI|nr:uncharacterized protein DNG_04367 [Cephalotrichum gorgonifer]
MDVCDPDPNNGHRKHSVISSRNVAGTVEQLRQTQRTTPRSKAIIVFCRGLRRGTHFQLFWDAVGGALGLAELMATFSLNDVRTICRHLGGTASALNARPERQAGLAQLVGLLHEPVQRDPRPLGEYYQDIVPACGLEMVEEWDDDGETEWTAFQRTCLFTSHREWYQNRFLENISLPPSGIHQGTTLWEETRLFQGDLAFSKTILSTLGADKEEPSRLPRDFLSAFAMPLLQRLVRHRRYDDETRDKFLNLVVRCINVHQQDIASLPLADLESLLQYAIQRWRDARVGGAHAATAATKQETELCLARLIELVPSNRRRPREKLSVLCEILLHYDGPCFETYPLLRLLLRHGRGYELDIDDDSPQTLSRLRDLTARGNRWPIALFRYLSVDDATRLFKILSAADVTGSFLARGEADRSGQTTVFQQQKEYGSICGDTEVVRYYLLAKSRKKGTDEPAWLARARALVHERRKKAQEGREWQQRDFWSRSAMNLCVAAGDMEMLEDTILWARRFINQGMVSKGLYTDLVFGTAEIRDLLSAIPGEHEDGRDVPSDRVAEAVAKDIEISGRIIHHLMETIKMDAALHPTEHRFWRTILMLPKHIIDCRLEEYNAASFTRLFDQATPGSDHLSSGAVERVWKPTIDVLVTAEGLLSSVSTNLSVQVTGAYVYQGLSGMSGAIRADLTSFVLERMRTHLGPEGLKVQMNKVVSLVASVAQSDQPWLAIPFVHNLILEGERSSDSMWHRQILTSAFLSSLPYEAANALLHAIADAIRGRMRQQNARPIEKKGEGEGEEGVPRPAAVKVTTVKMIAQLLQDSRIIGPSAACDILIGLLAEARHIDSLIAIVNSLLSILQRLTYSPEIHTRVLGALEETLSPILPRLSQRQPLSEADWIAAEEGEADLPDVSTDTPLISLFLTLDYSSGAMSHETKERLMQLLMHIPGQSALLNARWNKLFLAKNGFSLDDGECIPSAPACLAVSIDLLRRFASYAPASIFAMLREMALVNLNPTPGIARVTKAVKADRDLINSNAGRHWLAQFDNPGRSALENFGIRTAALLLQKDPGSLLASKRNDGEGLSVLLVGESLLAVADRIISCELLPTFGNLIAYLTEGRLDSRAKWLAWREHCVPILRAIATKIDGLRHRRQPSAEPVPKSLPSLFDLGVSILPIPYSNPPKEPALAEDVDAFVPELAALVEWLVESLVQRGVPYHDEFSRLKKEVRQGLKSGDYARVALRLGQLGGGIVVQGESGQGPTLAGYLRLDLAQYLLLEAGDPMDETCGVLPEVKQMVRGWVSSDDERVHLAGMAVVQKHKKVFSWRKDSTVLDNAA